jgi:WD40 repeat protein
MRKPVQEKCELKNLKYQAFISYSHDRDERLAAALQSSLSRFAKPWYRLRTMRIFRDRTTLSANPALWHSIEQALSQSEYFLLLAAPSSAKSPWVQREVQWWLQNRLVEKLVIGLTDGVISWDNRVEDFDWGKTTALPSCLKGAFPAEPLYADFRAAIAEGKYLGTNPAYRGALLDVVATITERPKEDLDSEDIRIYRTARRTAWGAAVFIVMLGFIAGYSVIEAHKRQKTAASQTLASKATSGLADRSQALLLSLESRRIADTVESKRSLLTTIQRVHNAEAFLWGHTDTVTKAVFSPDGETVLSAGWDDRIVLWSTATHEPIGQPIISPKGLVSVAFSPSGSRFASTAGESVVIWDTQSQKPVDQPFSYDKEHFVHVAFSTSGKLLAANTGAVGIRPARVFVWDMASHQLIGEPVEGGDFAFSPDDTLLAIAQYGNLVLWDLQSRRVIGGPFTGHAKNISVVAFNPDGSLVATGSEDMTIKLWDVKSHNLLGTLEGHTGTVTSLLFGSTGAALLSGSSDGTIVRWDVGKLKAIETPVKAFGASISSIFLTSDSRVKAMALEKERAIILNVNDDPPLGRRIRAPSIASSNIAFSPDDRSLASSGEFGDVLEWDVATGELNGAKLSGHKRQVTSLAYVSDGKVLVSGSIDGNVIFWDTSTREALGPPTKAHRSPVWSLACSPDGKTMVSGGNAQLVFWNISTRERMGPPTTSQKERIWALAFSPDGKFLASGGNNLEVAIWEIAFQPLLVKTLGTPVTSDNWELTPMGASFSPDGTLLATSTREHSVTLWNVRSGQPIQPVLYAHTGRVSSLAFRMDGEVLASGSADGDIRLWDVKTHEWLGTLSAHQEAIKSVVFSSKKGTLASVGGDNSIIFWDVDFQDWFSRACRIANRNLTPKEWNVHFGTIPYRKTCPEL